MPIRQNIRLWQPCKCPDPVRYFCSCNDINTFGSMKVVHSNDKYTCIIIITQCVGYVCVCVCVRVRACMCLHMCINILQAYQVAKKLQYYIKPFGVTNVI